MMNVRSLFSLALAVLVPAVQAQQGGGMLVKLAAQESAVTQPVSLKARERVFSALGALPADTDSFFAVNKLGELAALLQGQFAPAPGLEPAALLDSLAVGITPRTVQDLQRLQPLFQVLSAAQNEVAESWRMQANAEAARAIVAVQREQKAADGARLVQSTKDFHLAPIYLALTVRPGGELLLQQLSVLPLMLPIGSDAPIEMTVRSGWRGFCVHGSMLDLSAAELAPEHENQIHANLQKARLYVLARTVGNKLVLVMCSNPDEVKIPAKKKDSVLAAPQMAAFDSILPRGARAVGYSSPAVVKLREELNLFDYQYVATFMERVFLRLAGGDETCAAAASAVKSLLDAVAQVLPAQHGAERMALWKEPPHLFLHLVSGAGAERFAPGSLRYTELAGNPDTVLYAETTPLTGTTVLDIPAVLNSVETVQNGYIATLRPEHAAEMENLRLRMQQSRPAMEKLGTGLQNCLASLAGSGALVLRDAAAGAPYPFEFSLRGEFTDESVAGQTCALLRSGLHEIFPAQSSAPAVETSANVVLLSYGSPPLGLVAPESVVPVPGGGLFSVNFPALVRMLEKMDPAGTDSRVQETLECARGTAEWVERVDAATRTTQDELHTLIRILPAE